MKKIIVLFLLFFVTVSVAGAEIFKVTKISEGLKKVRARDKDSGKNLWQSSFKTQKIMHQGKPFLYVEENGSGIYGSDKKFKKWKGEGYFIVNGTQLIPYQVKEVYRDKSGKLVKAVDKFYDQKTKKVICRVDGKNKKFDFKPDLIDKQILAICSMNYPFESKRDFKFHLLTAIPSLFKMTMKYRGIENLKVGNKTVKCYKLEMIPDLGALNLLGAFVPKTYFWYKVAAPHEFVRYEGLESGLGTPYIVMERVN